MEENKSSKLEKFLAGKGFYIVLALCIVVIGISAWSIVNHSVAKNVNIDSGVSLEDGGEGDTAPVMSEATPSPVIEDMDISDADETAFIRRMTCGPSRSSGCGPLRAM